MEAQKDEAARGKARRAGQTTDARMRGRDLPAEPSVEKRGEHTEKAETQRGGEHDAERSAESKAEPVKWPAFSFAALSPPPPSAISEQGMIVRSTRQRS